MLYSPLFHGTAGILDELLLITAPLVVAVTILIIASRRARARSGDRQRPTRQPPRDS